MPSTFESQLGHSFHDPSLLQLALTHASFGHEKNQRLPHNERLEFLGDAVLQIIISEHLYQRFPNVPEGHLTKVRAHLVSRNSLVALARHLQLGTQLVLGPSEETQGGRERASNLANAFEAILGALYLDGGLDAARRFLLKEIEPRLNEISDNPEPENAKGILQETLHARGQSPVYRIVTESGPPHQRQFEAVVEIDGIIMGKGTGATKKEAETLAAQEALRKVASNKS